VAGADKGQVVLIHRKIAIIVGCPRHQNRVARRRRGNGIVNAGVLPRRRVVVVHGERGGGQAGGQAGDGAKGEGEYDFFHNGY